MKKYLLQLVSFILLFCFSYNARARENNSISQNHGIVMDSNIAENGLYNNTSNNTPDNMNKTNMDNSPTHYTMVVFIGVPIGTLVYGMATWNWGEEKGFHVRHEGFFGENTANGGADKVGHAFSHYIAFRVLHNYYDWSENGKNTKWFYSITTAASLVC